VFHCGKSSDVKCVVFLQCADGLLTFCVTDKPAEVYDKSGYLLVYILLDD